jgi:hypothetical protein
VTIAIIILLGGLGNSLCIGTKAQTADGEVNSLILIIENEELRAKSPEQVAKAIERIAVIRTSAAAPSLANLLTFSRKLPGDIDGFDAHVEISIVTPSSRYPAVGALSAIGEPALPVLTKVLEENESNSLISENAVYAIISIFKFNLNRAAEYLNGMANTASSAKGNERILEVSRKLLEKANQASNR